MVVYGTNKVFYFVLSLFMICSFFVPLCLVKTAYKPVSVLSSYLSRINITINFKQPTQTLYGDLSLYLVLLPVGFALPFMLP